MKKIEFFKVEGNRITRIRKHCPKCGPAVFLAEHKDRFGCGKCGYTEYKGSVRKEPVRQPVEEKTVEQPETSKIHVEEKPVSESDQLVEPSGETPKPNIPRSSPIEESIEEEKNKTIDTDKKDDEESTEPVINVEESTETSEKGNEEKPIEESDKGESKKEVDKSKDSK